MDSSDSKSGGQSTDGSQNPSQNWCPICKTETSDRAVTDTCGHEFCLDCLKQWSAEHNSCPVCRQIYSKIIANIGPNGVIDEIPVRQPIQRLFDNMNQMIHDLEELFILRLQQLKESISIVEQSLQTLKALVRQMEANWELTHNPRNGRTLVVSSDQPLNSNREQTVAESFVSDNSGQNSSQSEEISSPKSKRQKTESASNEESVEDN